MNYEDPDATAAEMYARREAAASGLAEVRAAAQDPGTGPRFCLLDAVREPGRVLLDRIGVRRHVLEGELNWDSGSEVIDEWQQATIEEMQQIGRDASPCRGERCIRCPSREPS